MYRPDFDSCNKVTVYKNGQFRVVLRLRNSHPGFRPWVLNGLEEVAKYCDGGFKFYHGYSDRKGPMMIPRDVMKAAKKAASDCASGKYDKKYSELVTL